MKLVFNSCGVKIKSCKAQPGTTKELRLGIQLKEMSIALRCLEVQIPVHILIKIKEEHGGSVNLEEKLLSLLFKFLTEEIAAVKDLMVLQSLLALTNAEILIIQPKADGQQSNAEKLETPSKFKVLLINIFISVVSEFGLLKKLKNLNQKKNLLRKKNQ